MAGGWKTCRVPRRTWLDNKIDGFLEEQAGNPAGILFPPALLRRAARYVSGAADLAAEAQAPYCRITATTFVPGLAKAWVLPPPSSSVVPGTSATASTLIRSGPPGRPTAVSCPAE